MPGAGIGLFQVASRGGAEWPTLAYFTSRNTLRYDLNRLQDYATGYTLLGSDMTSTAGWASDGAAMTISAEAMPETGQPSIRMAHTTATYRYLSHAIPEGTTFREWYVVDFYIDNAAEANGLRLEFYNGSGTLLFWQNQGSWGGGGVSAPDIVYPRTGLNQTFFRTSLFSGAAGAQWADVRQVRYRLRTNGGPVNIWMGRLENVDLRPKVTFTFDDQNQSVYDTAYPLMSAKGMAGAIAVVTGVPNLMDVPANYSHASGTYLEGGMSAANLAALKANGWDLVSHTVTHPNLNTMFTEGLEAEIRWEMEESRKYLESTFGPGLPNNVLIAPYGSASTEGARAIALETYTSVVNSTGQNGLLLPQQVEPLKSANTWTRLARVAGDNRTAAQMIADVDTAIANQQWLVFMFHIIHPTTGSSVQTVQAEFEGLLDYLDANSAAIDVVTLSGMDAALRGA
jgi:peptidoglycan/xylan/chitin deacetylase (PgdA/CDA1 family)